eukprot:COSAG04_NODE_25005_length_313_cov_0.962617_1_plen_59_part_01
MEREAMPRVSAFGASRIAPSSVLAMLAVPIIPQPTTPSFPPGAEAGDVPDGHGDWAALP